MSIDPIVALLLIVGVVVVIAVLFVIVRARRSRPGSAPAAAKRPAPAAQTSGANQSPTFLPKRGSGLGAGSFITPLGSDGTPFEITLLEVTPLDEHPNFGMALRFAVKNRNAFSLLVVVPISYTAYLDCDLEREFDHDASPRLVGQCVMDAQRKQLMFGRNNDNQLLFGPDEVKEFAIQFDKPARDFQSFDIEYALEAEGCPYGRYRLRYDFQSRRFTRRFLVAPLQRPW